MVQRPATREREKERETKQQEREREKDLGRKRACESLGATQPSPQQTLRLLGPCGPKQTLEHQKNQTGGGLSPSAREAHCIVPGEHFPRAQARPPAF